MANPNPPFGGQADRSEEGWEDRTLEKVQQFLDARYPQGRRGVNIQLYFDQPFMIYLRKAAKKRGISINGYGRRALAKQIAKDLGLPWETVLAHCPKPAGFGQPSVTAKGPSTKTRDDGLGFGDWT